MLLLGLVIVAFGALVAIFILGDQPRFRGTWIHSLYLTLTRASGRLTRWLGIILDENPAVGSLLRWLVPVFYCCIVTFCIYLFFANVYGKLPPEFKGSLFHHLWIFMSIACVAASTTMVTFVDPGTTTASNVDLATSLFPANGLIFFEKRCSTCNLQKPARSKHCSTCNKCVLLYDHHCLWVNNCIGLRNYRWFMAYLVLNINMMFYGGILCFLELRYQRHLHYQNWGWWALITRTTEYNRIAGILTILTALFVPITSIFTILHLRYLYLGITTNEADKWGEIEHLVGLNALVYIVEKGQYAERATMRDADGSFTRAYLSLDDEIVLFTEKEESRYTIRRIQLMETDLDNIYDKGFWNNFKERVLTIAQI